MPVYSIDVRFATDEDPIAMRDLVLEATAELGVVVGDIAEVMPIESVLVRLNEDGDDG